MSTLTDSLAVIIDKATSAVETGVAFLSAQIPDVIHQLLMWHFTLDILVIVVPGLFLAFMVWLCFKVRKTSWFYDYSDVVSFPAFLLLMITSISCVIWVISSFHSILDAVQIWIAPKIWLIEYAANLVKGNK